MRHGRWLRVERRQGVPIGSDGGRGETGGGGSESSGGRVFRSGQTAAAVRQGRWLRVERRQGVPIGSDGGRGETGEVAQSRAEAGCSDRVRRRPR